VQRRTSASASALDERLLLLARTRGHTGAVERMLARFSRIGEHGGVWLAIAAAGRVLDAPRAPAWRRVAGSVASAYVLNSALKLAVRRRRPRLAGLPPLTGTPTGLSFPSAHASTSFAGALACSRMGLPRLPLYALACGLAVSRVYLGVHYPSDVLAGAALGSGVATVIAPAREPAAESGRP